MIHAALDLIDVDGVEALSMRKLGQVLGRDPMRVYSHTESKAALLDAVGELVLEGLSVPPATGGDWETALRLAARSFRQMAVDHPRMIRFLLTRPLPVFPSVVSMSSLRWMEDLLTLLAEAGFDEAGALHAYRFYTGFLVGHILQEVHDLVTDADTRAVLPGPGAQFVTHQRYPRIHALGSALTTESGATDLVLGLDLVLMGLRRVLDNITDSDRQEK